ncbi:MAG TPA: AMP-binding protein, partial [Candidatus Binatia bacterium]|nr:AMP-binding protein [Candidatus Binatia bacterium]
MSAVDAQTERAIFARLIQARAEEEPDRRCLVFEQGEHPAEDITYRDLATRGNQVAVELQRLGLHRGDRVGIMLRNHPEFVYGMVGASQLGLVTVPVDPRARGERLRYFLSFADCGALLVADYVLGDPDAAGVIRDVDPRTLALSTPEGRAAGIDVTGRFTLNEILEGPERSHTGHHADSL